MSLVFGPKKLGIGISDPSQVIVVELVNGLPSSAPVNFTAPVTVTSSGISFEVADAGRYRVTAKNPYASESVTVDLSPDLPYASDIQSKVDYLIATGGNEGGAVSSVNGKTGVVVLTASDVSARPASWVPSWNDVSGKPATFAPSAHTHVSSDITDFDGAVEDVVEGMDIGGDVASVNGQTGTVVLNAEDVGARADDWEPDLSGYATTNALNSGLSGKADSTDLDDKLDVGTGTQDATTYRRGDGTWATPTNTTYAAISQVNIENPASTAPGLITGQRLAQGVAANESIQSIVGGSNVTIDDTDPRNPVINASGGGGFTDYSDVEELDGYPLSFPSTISDVDGLSTAIDARPVSSTISEIWTGTQTQYDAIGTKDSETLYLIVED